jgi:hypothetical protein
VRWPLAFKNVSPGAEDCPLLEDVTKQYSEDVTGNTSLCVIVICKVLSQVVC